MKKLTAGIFASLLAVVATGAANAKIASQAYVDEKDAERVAVQQETNNGILTTSATGAVQVSSSIPQARVDGLDTALAGKADKATTLEGYGITDGATKDELTEGLAGKVNNADITDMQVKANLTTNAEWATEKASDDKYPSNAAVDAAISEATSKLPTSGTITEIQGNITKIQGDVAGLKTSKQDADTAVEVGTAGTAVGSTTQPVYVNESGVVTPTNALGSLAWESTVGTAEIENNAVTTAKIGDGQVTKAKIADGVVPTVTTSIVTGNTDAAQAGAVATALAGKADAADLDTKVDANAAITAGTGTKITYDAKGLVTGSSNLTAADIPALTTDKITGLDTELDSKASQTDLTALTGRVTTAEGDIDALQAPKATVATGQTGPVSGQTVYEAIQEVTGDVTGVTESVTALEGEMDQAQSDITELKTGKQDKLTGPVGSATQPVYVNAQGNVVAGTAYGPLATKTQIANADVANDAAIAQSKIANLVTDLAAKITAPATSETGETGTWVLTYDGTDFQWEDITRAGE